MKKNILILVTLIFTSAFAMAQSAAPAPVKPAKQEKPAKAPKIKAASTSDADVQSCITQRLAAAPKLKTQGFGATVSGGVATFTGAATDSGSKGGVSGIAKTCGAKSVVNNITIPTKTKPAAAPKPAATPKPTTKK